MAWVWLAGGSGEPSTELTTPEIGGAPTTTAAGESETTEPASRTVTFVIDNAQSIARFGIDEELRGEPKRVVGETDQVAGQMQVDLDDLSSAQFPAIVINARTFRTDAERRDRAIREPIILNSASDEQEFISLEIISAEGLSGSVSPGDTVEFTVTGDLLIRDTTNPVTFDVTVTLVDEGRIEGSATATVLRSDFTIGIPAVPRVANVGDQVTVSLDFVAVAG